MNSKKLVWIASGPAAEPSSIGIVKRPSLAANQRSRMGTPGPRYSPMRRAWMVALPPSQPPINASSGQQRPGRNVPCCSTMRASSRARAGSGRTMAWISEAARCSV
jgi:hypothetical protein